MSVARPKWEGSGGRLTSADEPDAVKPVAPDPPGLLPTPRAYNEKMRDGSASHGGTPSLPRSSPHSCHAATVSCVAS